MSATEKLLEYALGKGLRLMTCKAYYEECKKAREEAEAERATR